MSSGSFTPPPYPHDRLVPIIADAASIHDEVVDLSIGTPFDPPSSAVMEALVDPGSAKSYPPSSGTKVFREAAADWFERRLGVVVGHDQLGACIGTKELVAGLPQWLRLRTPERDTVLYPAVSYPTYAMGAHLGGCRAVPVGIDENGSLDLDSIDPEDARRALCIWSNSPSNPTGALDDLGAVAGWGRDHQVPVFSDECYLEFTWQGPVRVSGSSPGESILNYGSDGVVAVNSLSKRSNLAGLRVGFYAGDPELVGFLEEIRKHSGLMVPGPAQRAGVVALHEQLEVDEQRHRYSQRLDILIEIFLSLGLEAQRPAGGFYLWIESAEGDGWQLTRQLAETLGLIVSPGEFYGPTAHRFIRVAAVQPERVLDKILQRARGIGPLTDNE